MDTASNLNKAERIAYIDDRLQALYPETPVPLDHTDPFTLLIAVLLSAQCTDERVNQVTPGLFAKADCPEDMIQLSVEEIRSIIEPWIGCEEEKIKKPPSMRRKQSLVHVIRMASSKILSKGAGK